MSELTEVKMQVTDAIIDKTNKLRQLLNTNNNAEAVAIAIASTFTIANSLQNGGDLLVKNSKGRTYQISVPGLHG